MAASGRASHGMLSRAAAGDLSGAHRVPGRAAAIRPRHAYPRPPGDQITSIEASFYFSPRS